MSKRNKISISPFQGENILLVNGFSIQIIIVVDSPSNEYLEFAVYRKGTMVKSCKTLQEAVKWCED